MEDVDVVADGNRGVVSVPLGTMRAEVGACT